MRNQHQFSRPMDHSIHGFVQVDSAGEENREEAALWCRSRIDSPENPGAQPTVVADEVCAAVNREWMKHFMEDLDARQKLTRMDMAFTDYSQEAEKLSVLLAETRDPSSWTLYHNLLRQRTAEVVAFEKYRDIRDDLFASIHPPVVRWSLLADGWSGSRISETTGAWPGNERAEVFITDAGKESAC
jgi:hypothetical protein